MNDIGVIHATNGGIILVDAEDFPVLTKHNWQLFEGRAIRGARPQSIRMHRFLMSAPKGVEVDHKNRLPWINCKWNLRFATRSQQLANRSKAQKTSSKFKGVCWDKRNKKWMASIKISQRNHHLGRYESERDAAIAYNGAAMFHFGEFALLNEV